MNLVILLVSSYLSSIFNSSRIEQCEQFLNFILSQQKR
jgi:hypothetical protein